MKTRTFKSNEMNRFGATRSDKVRKLLLMCGILASIVYLAASILGAIRWEGYSPFSQAISELFALGAPSKSFVDPLFIAYSLLWIAFGVGVWQSAGGKRALRIAGAGLVIKEVEGLIVQLYFPVPMRGFEGPNYGMLHTVLSYIGVAAFLIAMGFGPAAFGKRFRLYSIATLVVSLIAGLVIGLYVPALAANQPTPGMGIWERIMIFSYLLWAIVLAIGLLRTQPGGLPAEDRERIPPPKATANQA